MEQRSAWLRGVLRAALVLSLLAAVVAGALFATELRPSNHAAAARQHEVDRPVQASTPPARTSTAGATAVSTMTTTATATAPATATATATAVPTPAAPSRAMLSVAGGRAQPYGAWVRATSVTLRITLPPAQAPTTLVAEAEVQSASVPFSGAPTARAIPVRVQTGESARVTIPITNLQDGQRYHWRVRVRAADGMVSAWSGGGLFGVNDAAPPPPHLASSSVRLGAWNDAAPVTLRWTGAGGLAPIGHFEYAAMRGPLADSASLTWRWTAGPAITLPRLAQGYWHVLVRTVDAAGNASQPTDWAFGLASSPPPAPRIVSADPAQGAISNLATPTVRWVGAAGLAPLAGYEYRLFSGSIPFAGAPWTPAAGARLALSRLIDGVWYVQVRSVDVLGHHSAPVTWSFQLDRTRPEMKDLALFTTSFTPPVERLHVSFTLKKAAAITYHVLAAGSKTVLLSRSIGMQQPGAKVLTWNGYLAHKKLAAAGDYTIAIDAVDAAGNRSEVVTQAVSVLDKRILISISKDELWAYQGKHLLMKTPVTNGGPGTPTLPGIFHVLGKYPNFVFHSPWPKGSPLWYPDSPTNFALLYQASGGYFIHDAPWRSVYGPGSNSVAGTPGGNYTGSHGCTNVPYDQMKWLYDWADTGTLVQIVK